VIVATIKPRDLSTPHPLMIFSTRIRETDQIFAHIENKSAHMESAMTFRQGVSGNPHGNRHRTRHLLNQEFMQALLLNFRQEGKRAIEKVARNQPGVYLKILALLVPREMQIEHTNRIKQMTDEEIEQAIEAIQNMLAAQAGEAAKVIEGTAEPAALPAPEASIGAGLEPKSQRRPNRLMMQADTAVGPQERTPRKRKVPSPPAA
jgi:histidinol dehydrogenase